MAAYSITDARPLLGDLVRRASHGHERIALTDHGRVAAIVISASDLEDMEDRLALAEHQARKAAGTSSPVALDDARARLGLTDADIQAAILAKAENAA